MGLAYHDTYWVNPDLGWHEIDRAKLNAEMLHSLKPGGVLGIIDHYADDRMHRTDAATRTASHRQRPTVVADLESAGFKSGR